MTVEELAVLFSNSFTKVYQEFDKLNERFDRMEKKFEHLDAVVDGHEVRISFLEEECVEA